MNSLDYQTISSYLAALKACIKARDFTSGCKIHSDLTKTGNITNLHVANTLLDLYTKCHRLDEARLLFDELRFKNTVTWNIIIRGAAENGQPELALHLFCRMQSSDGLSPEPRTVVAALRACTRLAQTEESSRLPSGELVKSACLERGFAIHSRAAGDGTVDVHVKNSLLEMYAECGTMDDSSRVFELIRQPDVHSWNALIRGYAQNGQGEFALELFSAMTDYGFSPAPDARTYVAAVLACTGENEENRLRSLERGMAVHSRFLQSSSDMSNIFVASALVNMYSKCGSVEDARRVFDRIVCPDVVSWTAAILGHAENRESLVALELFQAMQREGCRADTRTYVAALKACSGLAAEARSFNYKWKLEDALEKGMFIHAWAQEQGVESDHFVSSTLVDMYSKCGSMVDAELVFQRLQKPSLVAWNAIISGYVENGEPHRALSCFELMQRRSCQPDCRTFVAAVSACASLGDSSGLRTGTEIHFRWTSRNGHEMKSRDGVFLANALIDMYAKCGSISNARKVFDALETKSLVSWNTMLGGYSSSGNQSLALELYTSMQHEETFTPDVVTYLSVLKACAGLADLEKGREIHAEVCNAGLDGDVFITAALIDLFGKSGCMVEAREVFDSAPASSRQSVTWNSLLAGYCRQGDSGNVFGLFEMMKRARVQPDSVTFLCILTACSHAGLVAEGKEFFRAMGDEYGIVPGVEHYTCLVDLFGRVREVREAVEVARGMTVEADCVMLRTLLSALS